MKVIKPDNVSLLYSVFPNVPGFSPGGGDQALVLSIMVGFSFDPRPAGDLLLENMLWQRIQEALPEGETLDGGLPKPRAEYLVYGACCSRNPVRGKDILIRVGALQKRLHVFGPRFWHAHGPTRPQPFTRIPVDWRHAYGGKAYPDNPEGLGHARLQRGVHPLPLVEDPAHLVAFARQKALPAGLAAIPPHWPQRRKLLGRVDATWLERDWPALPRDCRPEYAFTALADQRFAGYLQGGESFSISGMHPEKEHLGGRVPSLRARMFIQRKAASENGFHEAPCRMETLWLFPGSQTGVVLFRGVARTADEECADIAAVQAALEGSDTPPMPLEHYKRECDHVLQRAKVRPTSIDPSPEPPAGPAPGSVAMVGSTLLAAAAMGSTGGAAASGTDNLATLAADLENEVGQHLGAIGVTSEQTEAFLQQAGSGMPDALVESDTSLGPLEQLGVLARNIEAEVSALLAEHGLDPASVEGVLDEQTATGQAAEEDFLAGMDRLLLRDDLPEQTRTAIQDAMSGFQGIQAALAALTARSMAAAASGDQARQALPPGLSTAGGGLLTTEQALERHRDGLGLAGCDLTGCDFTGRDLSGADLRRAILDGVCWPGVNLSGADLSGAFCREANLSGADLTRADLTRAVLEKAGLAGIRGTGCTAHRTHFQGANLRLADLRHADMQAADFSRANLGGANLTGVQAREARLNGARLQKAQCGQSDLSASRADATTDASQALFQHANLEGIRWGGAVLRQADLRWASMDNADLGKADLQQANLSMATARSAKFIKANLQGAGMTGLNLFQGSLRRANCQEARIEDANLFAVDLYRCALDPKKLKNVKLGRTPLQPRLLEKAA